MFSIKTKGLLFLVLICFYEAQGLSVAHKVVETNALASKVNMEPTMIAVVALMVLMALGGLIALIVVLVKYFANKGGAEREEIELEREKLLPLLHGFAHQADFIQTKYVPGQFWCGSENLFNEFSQFGGTPKLDQVASKDKSKDHYTNWWTTQYEIMNPSTTPPMFQLHKVGEIDFATAGSLKGLSDATTVNSEMNKKIESALSSSNLKAGVSEVLAAQCDNTDGHYFPKGRCGQYPKVLNNVLTGCGSKRSSGHEKHQNSHHSKGHENARDDHSKLEDWAIDGIKTFKSKFRGPHNLYFYHDEIHAVAFGSAMLLATAQSHLTAKVQSVATISGLFHDIGYVIIHKLAEGERPGIKFDEGHELISIITILTLFGKEFKEEQLEQVFYILMGTKIHFFFDTKTLNQLPYSEVTKYWGQLQDYSEKEAMDEDFETAVVPKAAYSTTKEAQFCAAKLLFNKDASEACKKFTDAITALVN